VSFPLAFKYHCARDEPAILEMVPPRGQSEPLLLLERRSSNEAIDAAMSRRRVATGNAVSRFAVGLSLREASYIYATSRVSWHAADPLDPPARRDVDVNEVSRIVQAARSNTRHVSRMSVSICVCVCVCVYIGLLNPA